MVTSRMKIVALSIHSVPLVGNVFNPHFETWDPIHRFAEIRDNKFIHEKKPPKFTLGTMETEINKKNHYLTF